MPCQPATPITQVSDAGRLLEPHRLGARKQLRVGRASPTIPPELLQRLPGIGTISVIHVLAESVPSSTDPTAPSGPPPGTSHHHYFGTTDQRVPLIRPNTADRRSADPSGVSLPHSVDRGCVIGPCGGNTPTRRGRWEGSEVKRVSGQILRQVVRQGVWDRLDMLDELASNADNGSLLSVARSELPRLTFWWGAVLAAHAPDPRGRCRECSKRWRPGSAPRGVWRAAHEHLVCGETVPQAGLRCIPSLSEQTYRADI
jgi:hypothetical protein